MPVTSLAVAEISFTGPVIALVPASVKTFMPDENALSKEAADVHRSFSAIVSFSYECFYAVAQLRPVFQHRSFAQHGTRAPALSKFGLDRAIVKLNPQPKRSPAE